MRGGGMVADGGAREVTRGIEEMWVEAVSAT
jgi:hypothetical protein